MRERLVNERRGQAAVLPDVIPGFHGFRYHHVRLAGGDQTRNLLVDVMDYQGRIRQVLAGELLV